MQRMLLASLLFTVAALGGDDAVREEYARKAASIPEGDAAAHYKLALWCQEKGLRMESIREMRVVVTLEPDHRAARRALGFEQIAGRWVSGKDAMKAKGFVKHDGVWLTPEEYKHYAADEVAAQKARDARLKGNAAIKMAWSKEPAERARAMGMIEDLEAEHRLRPLAIAARINYPDVRLRCVRDLGALNSAEALPPLYKRAIFDRDETIRKAAVEAIKATDAEGKIGPFVHALQSPFDSVRLHSIQALGALGDAGAVGPLVARYQIAGGSGQLVYITQVNQVSYVQDFDVEVAQTSFIADPVIGVVQDGLVHAFRVQAINGFYEVYEKPALAEALGTLTGQQLGEDPKAWYEYFRGLKEAEQRERDRKKHERVSGTSGS